jgi:hypothetical protein
MTDPESRHLSIEILELYLDRELDDSSIDLVTIHLDRCERCQRQLDEIRKLYQTIESIPERPLVKDMGPAVVAAIRSRESVPIPLRFLALIEVLVVLIILVIGWPLIRLPPQIPLLVNPLELVSFSRLIEILSELGVSLFMTLQRVPMAFELPSPVSGLILPAFAWTMLILVGVSSWFAMNRLLLGGVRTKAPHIRKD